MPGGGEVIRIDKPADLGVVITALQVIESQLLGKEVAERGFLGSPARRGALRAGIWLFELLFWT